MAKTPTIPDAMVWPCSIALTLAKTVAPAPKHNISSWNVSERERLSSSCRR